jgi:hypothetical protein
MANLASQLRYSSPGPVNSTTRSAAIVLRLNSFKIYRIVSLPPTPGGGLLMKQRLTVSGTLNQVCPVTRGIATSVPPMPMERQLIAPAEQECESAPMTSIPGCARSRKNSVCIIVYWSRDVNQSTLCLGRKGVWDTQNLH